MKKILAYLLIIVVILLLSSAFFFLYETRFFVGRASVTQYSFSPDNSYIFATPLQAKADGHEKIRVTVFILNNQGLGVLGKTVQYGDAKDLQVETIQGVTDSLGKAVFDISTQIPGEYYLYMTVDGQQLSQKVHLSFN